MHTIEAPPAPWGPPTAPEGRYIPTRPNGKRVLGWEDTNITLLAGDIQVSFRYLLAVLTGQRNCTLALLQQVAAALGITLTALITRMESAYELRCKATATRVDITERRRRRSGQRAMSSR